MLPSGTINSIVCALRWVQRRLASTACARSCTSSQAPAASCSLLHCSLDSPGEVNSWDARCQHSFRTWAAGGAAAGDASTTACVKWEGHSSAHSMSSTGRSTWGLAGCAVLPSPVPATLPFKRPPHLATCHLQARSRRDGFMGKLPGRLMLLVHRIPQNHESPDGQFR
jgi:hypothetical protein